MQFSLDPTGFPLVRIPGADFEVQLLPVAKVQFERFLAEPNSYGDIWYEQVLAVHGRASYRSFSDEDRERIFLGGIWPQEAVAFARWLGPEYDLPTVAQWRQACQYLSREPAASFTVPAPAASARAGPPEVLTRRLWEQLQPGRLLELSLMIGGLVEWVRHGKAFCGLGAPRSEFYPSLYNPLADEVHPLRLDQRLKYFGFRLVRRLRG